MTTSPKNASAEKKAKLLFTAAKAAKSFASILNFDELLQKTVDIICEEFDFYYAGVFLVDSEGKWANLTAGRGGAGKAMVAEGHRLEIGGNSMIGDCIDKKQARISLDVGEEAVFFKNPHLPETRSEMGLPLIYGGTAIGALTVQSTEEAAFTEEDIATLQTMADQLAVAIQNAWNYEKEQRRSKYLEAANRVGKNLTSILDLTQLLPETVNIICDEYNFYYAGVFLADDSNEWAVLRAGRGKAGEEMIKAGHKLQIGGNSMIGDCIKTKQARISLDVGDEAVFFKNPFLPATRSEMALPLVVGEEVLGAITVQSELEAAFNDEDISTLQTMADLLAVAIKNAYTLKQLDEAHKELLRQKTYEALATANTQAIHWIGNKALPITTTARRIKEDLDDKVFDIDSIKEDIDMIIEGAELIVEIKEKLIGQAMEHAPRPLLLPDLVETAFLELDTAFDNFSLAVEDGTPYIVGDSTQVVQGFINLLTNSIEANAKEISVTVEADQQNELILVKIKDDGDGIPEDMIENVWASFITTKGNNRHGLGLPATLNIISQHKGTIEVISREGEGTTFIISLPMAPAPEMSISTKVDKDVCVISSELFYTDWVKHFLDIPVAPNFESAGIRKVYLVNGDQKNISELVESKAEITSKFVLMTNFLTVDKTTNYLSKGVDDVVLKPYSAHELDEILGNL